jgi:NADP-dependent 3-hydroxy acid dehydrogenase YdfG
MNSNAQTSRTVALTGASKGIGFALVQALTAGGYTVVAGARDVSNLANLPNVTALVLDVTNPSSVAAFSQAAIAQNASVLINNAGVGVFKLTEEFTLEDYHYVMDTNVLGMLLMTQAFIPHFRAIGSSQVINITSDVSSRTFAHGALYTASKFAQRAMTRALSCEGQSYGLRVTEIRSGKVDTFFAGTPQGADFKQQDLRPEDVARAVVYALEQPENVRLDEILVHPTSQPVEF